MKFITVFTNFEEIHLTKDVGMIPAAFANYNNAKSFIFYWSKKRSEISHVYGENFILSPILSRFKIIYYIKMILKVIYLQPDCVNLYHLKKETYFLSLIFSIFRITIYTKMDMNSTKFPNFIKLASGDKSLKSKLLLFLLDNIHVLSTEHRKFHSKMCELSCLKNKTIYLPNAVYENSIPIKPKLDAVRENIILVVGRFGDYQKNHELLLQSLESINSTKGWEIKLIGSMDDNFKHKFDLFKHKKPIMACNIEYLGVLSRDELFNYYSKSKILLVTSRIEGMSLAMVEASCMGMALLTTDIDGSDILTNNGYFGKVIKQDSLSELLIELESIFDTGHYYDNVASERNSYLEKEFSLYNSVKVLRERLEIK